MIQTTEKKTVGKDTQIIKWDWKESIESVLRDLTQAQQEGFLYIQPIWSGDNRYTAVMTKGRVSRDRAKELFQTGKYS